MSDPGSRRDAILEFWQWWSDRRDSVLAQLHAGGRVDFVEPLSEHVKAIHPDLQWEFGPGTTKTHHLCVTGGGDPRLRVLAEHWRAAGPDDPDFDFHCARQRVPTANLTIEIGDVTADLGDFALQVSVDDAHQRFDIVAWHPAFDGLEERGMQTLLFLALDQALGEDAVETWLGGIELGMAMPPSDEALTLDEMWTLVVRAPQRWPEPAWALGEVVDPDTGAHTLYAGCTSAKYLLDPMFDTVCVARLPYEANTDGMPTTLEEKARVDAFEDLVTDELGDAVRALCRSTGEGERCYWFYLQAENGPARVTLDRLAEQIEGPVELRFAWDPGWRELPM